jgi:hypothetical protein
MKKVYVFRADASDPFTVSPKVLSKKEMGL